MQAPTTPASPVKPRVLSTASTRGDGLQNFQSEGGSFALSPTSGIRLLLINVGGVNKGVSIIILSLQGKIEALTK